MKPATALAATLLALSLAGCQGDKAGDPGSASSDDSAEADDSSTSDDDDASGDSADTDSDDAGTPTDEDAVPLVVVIDQHAIDAAQLAQSRASRQDVRDFATMLEAEHRANLQDAKALPGADTGSQVVSAQKARGEQAMDTLQSASDFDAAYLDAVVDSHQHTLDLLDTQLIPAGTGAVRDFLVRTRATVAAHQDKARALQEKVQEKGSE